MKDDKHWTPVEEDSDESLDDVSLRPKKRWAASREDWREYLLSVLGVLVVGGGGAAGMIWMDSYYHHKKMSVKNWKQVDGVVEFMELKPGLNRKARKVTVVTIRFRYEIDGKKHVGTRLRYSGGFCGYEGKRYLCRHKNVTEHIRTHLKKGTRVKLHLPPGRPDRAELRINPLKVPSRFARYIGFFLIAAALVTVMVLTLKFYDRNMLTED